VRLQIKTILAITHSVSHVERIADSARTGRLAPLYRIRLSFEVIQYLSGFVEDEEAWLPGTKHLRLLLHPTCDGRPAWI
jgi:hypothetical protein